MKERPILFSAPMVRAILAGTKTQTRRIVKSEHAADADIWRYDGDRGMWESGIGSGAPGSYGHGEYVRCPYGAAGDRLWVREAFAYSVRDPDSYLNDEHTEEQYDAVYRATSENHGEWTNYDDDGKQTRIAPPWKPSIHMPRWASRITLDVTGVRVERLHDISELDALAEGVEGRCVEGVLDGKRGEYIVGAARDAYADLWRTINGAESWDANPWVWVVEFKRIEQIARAA